MPNSFMTDSTTGFHQAQQLHSRHLLFKFTGFTCTVQLSNHFLRIIHSEVPKRREVHTQMERGPGIFNYKFQSYNITLIFGTEFDPYSGRWYESKPSGLVTDDCKGNAKCGQCQEGPKVYVDQHNTNKSTVCNCTNISQ